MLQSLSVPLQNGVGFLQHPLPAIPSAFLADAPAPEPGRNAGFTMLGCNDTNDLAPAIYTGSPGVSVCFHCRGGATGCVADFGRSLSASLARWYVTVPVAVHLCWAFHPACPPDRVDAGSRGDHLTEVSSSRRRRKVVSAASDPTVTSRASADRLLRTEPQVRLMFSSYRTITATTLFRTHALLLVGTRILRPPIFRRISSGNANGFPATIRRDFHRITGDVAADYPAFYPLKLPDNLRATAGNFPATSTYFHVTNFPRTFHILSTVTIYPPARFYHVHVYSTFLSLPRLIHKHEFSGEHRDASALKPCARIRGRLYVAGRRVNVLLASSGCAPHCTRRPAPGILPL